MRTLDREFTSSHRLRCAKNGRIGLLTEILFEKTGFLYIFETLLLMVLFLSRLCIQCGLPKRSAILSDALKIKPMYLHAFSACLICKFCSQSSQKALKLELNKESPESDC